MLFSGAAATYGHGTAVSGVAPVDRLLEQTGQYDPSLLHFSNRHKCTDAVTAGRSKCVCALRHTFLAQRRVLAQIAEQERATERSMRRRLNSLYLCPPHMTDKLFNERRTCIIMRRTGSLVAQAIELPA
jgi:hypothetical protein